jgi:hypothetical protein
MPTSHVCKFEAKKTKNKTEQRRRLCDRQIVAVHFFLIKHKIQFITTACHR